VEWIVVNDGSSPSAAVMHHEIVKTTASSLCTSFIRLTNPVGLALARNEGLARAKGEWIVVCDSDDRVSAALAESLASLRDTVEMACFEVTYFNETWSEHRRVAFFERLFRSHGGTSLDPFLWFDFYYHGIMGRRRLMQKIGGYVADLRVGEDQDILLRALEAIGPEQLAFFHSIGYEYRLNENGVCRQNWEEVLKNYTSTMLAGARRRGSPFIGCRLRGTRVIEGSTVDCYDYELKPNLWLSWDEWRDELRR
jgi:glycosyltransferase involved in cell wall biosynthesis